MHIVLQSVFSGYSQNKWHQELIVRVPQLLAQYGSASGREILIANPWTAKLLEYFDNYVAGEIEEFISDGPLNQARQTVHNLNKELGLFQIYQNYQIRFKKMISLDYQREGTPLLIIATPHPFLTFSNWRGLRTASSRRRNFSPAMFFAILTDLKNRSKKFQRSFPKWESANVCISFAPEAKMRIVLKIFSKF